MRTLNKLWVTESIEDMGENPWGESRMRAQPIPTGGRIMGVRIFIHVEIRFCPKLIVCEHIFKTSLADV